MFRFLLFLIFLNYSHLSAQENGERFLKWSADKPLTWADYEGKPEPNGDAAASTSTVLTIDYKMSAERFSYKIKSYFSKTNSWGLHKTPYILSHEQGHFDIAEIFARKLHKEMSEYRFNKKTFEKELPKIYEKVTEEKVKMQDDYDKETRHSINKETQAEWLKKIAALLKEYNDWADY